MSKIIAIANQKGGVGKTTTAINVSSLIAAAEKKTLLIDIDPQANSSSGLNLHNHSPSVYDVLINQENISDVIIDSYMPFLDILPSNINLVGAEIEMVEMEGREKVLDRALSGIVNNYDYIIIDCPPSLGLLTLNSLAASDSVLIPVQCEYFALEGLGQLTQTLQLVRSALFPELKVRGVVLTMFDGRTRLSSDVVDEVNRHFPDQTFKSVVPRSIRLAEAPSYGLPISAYAPGSSGAQAYENLARELLVGDGVQVPVEN
ncbi:MAG: AAA family ATPase [Gammaproteobacteria bacterium]|nr:AAA family ATPase [Gammaproteobacteria bacterium]